MREGRFCECAGATPYITTAWNDSKSHLIGRNAESTYCCMFFFFTHVSLIRGLVAGPATGCSTPDVVNGYCTPIARGDYVRESCNPGYSFGIATYHRDRASGSHTALVCTGTTPDYSLNFKFLDFDDCVEYSSDIVPHKATCVPGNINQRNITCDVGYYAIFPAERFKVMTGPDPFTGCYGKY